MPWKYPAALRTLARRLYWQGMSQEETARRVGCSWRTVYRILKANPWRPRNRSPRQLSLAEREELSRALEAEESFASIGRRLKRATSTISREVKTHGGRREYRAWKGEQRADKLAARPRSGKFDDSPKLRAVVERWLELGWSPAQIAMRLKVEYPNDPTMRVSHETIYKSLYLQGRGTLRKELTKYLRQARKKRGTRTSIGIGRLPNMVNISERPAEAGDRAVPGHWEGDLLIGRDGKSAIGTLVERSTRYLMLLHLPDGKTAERVRQALTKKIQALPRELRRSLTWDQGKELSQHAQFTIDTGVRVFFCDPHSPWQRGSNENTNGLLRQYFPKGVDLNEFSATQLDAVARQLNGRPRQTLGWRTPAEKLDEFLGKRAA